MNSILIVKPIDIPEYNYKHSKHDIMPKLSLRGILAASSTGGKTVLIQNLILNIYRGSFEKKFSPSTHVDDTWNAVKKYIREVMNVDTDREPTYFKEYTPEALNKIIQTQHKVIDYQKKNKQKNLHSILIVIDDFADDPKFVRYSNILHSLFTRGRHNAISVLLTTQKYNVLAPIVRLNASALFIFTLKNINEVNSFIEENSALVNKDELYQMYRLAVNDAPYSFLYINTNAKVNNMLFIRFEKALKIEEARD